MSQINNETMILAGLLRDESFFRKVAPYVKTEYFEQDSTKLLYKIIKAYADKYKENPNKTVLEKAINVGLANKSDAIINDAREKLNLITTVDMPNSLEYMVDECEKFCKNRSMYLAINEAIAIYTNNADPDKKKTMDIGAIPELVQQALAVSFDSHVGHDYDQSEEQRWEYYTTPENKIPFEIDYLNLITNGGVTKKTLNLFVAGVNVGKTMLLVYLAAMYKRLGYNVLYITNEINEMELAQRIDASLLNIDTDMLIAQGRDKYLSKFQDLKESTHGNLFIKEFPTGTCSANGIRALLHELELKKKFKPDIIINDYLTINKADNATFTGNTGNYFEKVSEEMRSLAMEKEVVMWSAAQFNSEGIKNGDPELTDIGSSLGIAKVCDMAWAVLRNESLDECGQLSFKQMKTRYHKTRYRRWNLGVDIGTQRVFQVEQSGYESYNDEKTESESKIDFKPQKQKLKV